MDLLKSNIGAPVSASAVLNKGIPKLKKNLPKSSLPTSSIGGADILGFAGSAINMATQLAVPGALEQDVDTSVQEAAMKNITTDVSQVNDLDTLQNIYQQTQSVNTLFNPNAWRPDGMQRIGTTFSDTLNGAMQGAGMGSMFGTIGAGVGAAAGGLAFFLKDVIGGAIADKKAEDKATELHELGEQMKETARRDIAAQSFNVMGNTKDSALLSVGAFGGPLHTGDFSNGVRFITEGGSHSENPLGGVPQGIAMDGIPNLVEEGEVIFNDYVYSKRLKVPQTDKELLGLKKDKEYTFAEAAEYIQRESEERPNDPISKRNLEEMMGRLQGSQETLKEKRDEQAFKRAINKMTPDELSMFMQQLQQPQQMQPMMAMQGMQPMQPTQSEIPMFGKGGLLGHRFDWGGFSVDAAGNVVYTPVSDSDLSLNSDWGNIYAGLNATQKAAVDPKIKAAIAANNTELMDPIFDPYVQQTYNDRGRVVDGNIVYDIAKPYTGYDIGEEQEAARKAAQNLRATRQNTNNVVKGTSFAQALRAAPIFGNLFGTAMAFADKPNYSNIERAERRINQVPYISPKPISNKIAYTPIDTNYIATQMGNIGIGTRRAIQESGVNRAGVLQALLADNYKTQTAIGDALMKARQANIAQQHQVAEFNRGTDQYNSQQGFEAARLNQALALNKANTLLTTGQLRDAEAARVQANRSTALTNLFQNIGNYGQDRMSRDMIDAAIKAGVWNLGDNERNYRKAYGIKNGGPLFTIKKKGGKHA